MKPPVELAKFQALELRVGTLRDIQPHPHLSGLSILNAKVNDEMKVLAPSSRVRGLAVGNRIVVATGLHPLRVGEEQFTATLIYGPVHSEIPSGSRLK